MRCVIDIECNSLHKPTKVWLIVCRDIDTGELHVFRPENEVHDRQKFQEFSNKISYWVGHNLLGYDLPNLERLGLVRRSPETRDVCDTLIISKMSSFSRPEGHSIESYGEEFGLEKIKFSDWSKYSTEMETYCVRDVDINLRLYLKLRHIIHSPDWMRSIQLEQDFQRVVVNALHEHGFAFDGDKATKLLSKVVTELEGLDAKIKEAFPPKLTLVREIHPKLTRYGTLNKSDFRWVEGGDLSEFNSGPFCRCVWKPFNASSHKQIVDILHKAGWSPTDKTQTHIDLERDISRNKHRRQDERTLDLETCSAKLEQLKRTGWKVNETNLSTLPKSAPEPARLLAKRILLESRRRTLTEWLELVKEDGRIHGHFQGIGAWTHRMSHQRPNTANIPNEHDINGGKKLLGKEMRALWTAPKKRLLVGVDAEGIQLRIFAHLIDDKEFTDALVRGKKADKSDPHSLNQRIIGPICRSRAAAKRFIYALLLGAGLWKLSQILECSETECKEALDRLLQRYQGWHRLKEETIPRDARHGYFVGLDGRKVSIPGSTRGERSHLAMSGYLQNGEAVIIKKAALIAAPRLEGLGSFFVDIVHDEFQCECANDLQIALRVGETNARAIEEAGREFGLKCPLAGSYYNEDLKDYTIGRNWSVTH